jgi:BON domain
MEAPIQFNAESRAGKIDLARRLAAARERIAIRLSNRDRISEHYPKESLAMKYLNRTASAIFLAVTLVTMMGCAATPTRESTGEYLDDAAVTTKVKAAMLDQPSLKSFDIHVVTLKGTVYLSGVVASRYAMDEAVKVARGIAGVRTVKNDMQVE